MKQEIHRFFAALMFYSRIPCPAWASHDAEVLNRATRYFPLIGAIIGGAQALLLALLLPLNQPMLAAWLVLALGIWLTGAFHEDGFADVCDAFGGGWTKADILRIMKDSRLGTFGTIGLIVLLITQALMLEVIITKIGDWATLAIMLVGWQMWSRLTPVVLMRLLPYAREDSESKAKPIAQAHFNSDTTIAVMTAILPILFAYLTQPHWPFTVIFAGILPLIYLYRLSKKWLGGYTGDVLGASQQLTAWCFLLLFLIQIQLS